MATSWLTCRLLHSTSGSHFENMQIKKIPWTKIFLQLADIMSLCIWQLKYMKRKSSVWIHTATSKYVDFTSRPVAAIFKICKFRKCHGLKCSTASWNDEFRHMTTQIYEKKKVCMDSYSNKQICRLHLSAIGGHFENM